MVLFHHNLWEKKQTPLDALRNAQLALRKGPELAGDLAALRGPKLKTLKIPEAAAVDPKAPRPKEAYPVRLWAAFVHSGPGR
jgi:hypothetical protein